MKTLFRIRRNVHKGMVDNNVGPDLLSGPKALTSQPLQTTNPLIARPLSGSPTFALL